MNSYSSICCIDVYIKYYKYSTDLSVIVHIAFARLLVCWLWYTSQIRG